MPPRPRTLPPSPTLTVGRIVGSEVRTRDDEPFGQIDHIVIDVEGGRIAYVVIGPGGFLGLGGEWCPVPFDQLDWTGEEIYQLRPGQGRAGGARSVQHRPRSNLRIAGGPGPTLS